MGATLNTKVRTATKWSTIGEIAAKLFTPISNMVLARLLTPEAFGVVTTLTMIITFAEIFTDAGFQKYLIQHEFVDDRDRDDSTNVAFWSNLIMSIVIWGVIAIFSAPLAELVGNPGLGHVLIIACVSIPLAAFSSIQMALFKRELDFKTLARVRIISTMIPLLVTVPLAFWLHSYWALVIGTITVNIVNAVLLTVFSKWKPRLFYSFEKFNEMFSFTAWSMIEAISIWLTGYIDVFIVGNALSQYYLGLYKTSSTLVGQIMGLITAITTPILFSALSRLQDNEKEFHKMFFYFQKIVGLLVIPIGMCIFMFSDLVTSFILGSQWIEASGFVGLWGLTSAVVIVLSHYSSEVYRAKGYPRLSVLSQTMHLLFLVPTVIISVGYGFKVLYISRSLIRLTSIVINLGIMGIVIKMPVYKMVSNIVPSCIAALCMCWIMFLPIKEGLWINMLYILLSFISYLTVISFFSTERYLLVRFINIINKKRVSIKSFLQCKHFRE